MIWNKYKWVIIAILSVVLLFTATLTYYHHKVSALKKELFDLRIRHVLEIDSLKTALIQERIRLTDSILSVEKERYDELLWQYNLTRKEYEKISSDYSDIIISRPEY